MPKRRYKPEEIVAKLRQVDVLVSRGEHGRCDPPNRRERGGLRDELLNGEIFYTLREAKSSSRAGAGTTMPSGLMLLSATNHQHRRSSCPHSPRGRLRYVDRLRRPRWRNRRSELTFHLDHSMKAGQPILATIPDPPWLELCAKSRAALLDCNRQNALRLPPE